VFVLVIAIGSALALAITILPTHQALTVDMIATTAPPGIFSGKGMGEDVELFEAIYARAARQIVVTPTETSAVLATITTEPVAGLEGGARERVVFVPGIRKIHLRVTNEKAPQKATV